MIGEVDRIRRLAVGLSWRELAEGAVGPGRVVVPQVLGQHPAQVLPARTEHGHWPDQEASRPQARVQPPFSPARLAIGGEERPRRRPARAWLTIAQTALSAFFPPQITLCSEPS